MMYIHTNNKKTSCLKMLPFRSSEKQREHQLKTSYKKCVNRNTSFNNMIMLLLSVIIVITVKLDAVSCFTTTIATSTITKINISEKSSPLFLDSSSSDSKVAPSVVPSSTPTDVKSGNNNNHTKKNNYTSNNNKKWSSNDNKNMKQRYNKKQPTKKNAFSKGELAAAKALNQNIVACETPSEILEKFLSVGGSKNVAGNAALNSVNFSTSLHRMAKMLSYSHGKGGRFKVAELRKRSLLDARFAIFVCALAEAFVLQKTDCKEKEDEMKPIEFRCREVSNISWAVAKLGLVPNSNLYPLHRLEEHRDHSTTAASLNRGGLFVDNVIYHAEKQDLVTQILDTCKDIRGKILEVARQRKANPAAASASASHQPIWLPHLRLLSAMLLDCIAVDIMSSKLLPYFNPQEMANLLYAFSTSSRYDHVLFDTVVRQFIFSNPVCAVDDKSSYDPRARKSYSSNNAIIAKPQELSNSVWAFATASIRSNDQIALLQYVANAITVPDPTPTASSSILAPKLQFLNAFKPQELSNTAWGVATLTSRRLDHEPQVKEESKAVHQILRAIATNMISETRDLNLFKPQEISNTLWSFATVGFGVANSPTSNGTPKVKDKDVYEDKKLLQSVLTQVANNVIHRLRDFTPQELNNLAWAYARLTTSSKNISENNFHILYHGIALEITNRYHKFSPQDISTTLWSFATLGYNVANPMSLSSFKDEEIGGEKENEKRDNVYHNMFMLAASRIALKDAPLFKPQELSNSVWALATAGMIPKYPSVFDTTLYPSRTLRDNYSYITSDPITECFASVGMEAIRRPHKFKEQEIKDVLWSFSKAAVRHPILFRKVAEHLVGAEDQDGERRNWNNKEEHQPRGLKGFQPQGIGNLVYAYAKQALLADSSHNNAFNSNTGTSSSNKEAKQSGSSNGRLAVYETCCLDVGESLINRLFTKVATTCSGNLSNFKPQDLSNTAWSFATLGLLHQSFFQNIADQTSLRLKSQLLSSSTTPKENKNNKLHTQFKAQEIANLVWSFATLNFRQEKQKNNVLDDISDYVYQAVLSYNTNKEDCYYDEHVIAKLFNRQELANLAWSFTVLEHYPTKLFPLLYTGLLGSSSSYEHNSNHLRKVYNDLGLQKQAIMSLLYVQLALDVEASDLGLKLPSNFPDGWGEIDVNGKNGNNIQTPLPSSKSDTSSNSKILELNTSRLQSSVSRACNRIGFHHTQEYVLQAHHLIVPSHSNDDDDDDDDDEFRLDNNAGFLSIDIADIEQKIGIEVDGPAHFINLLDDGADADEDGVTSTRISPMNSAITNTEGYELRKGGEKRWQFRWSARRQVNGPTALKHRLLCHLGWCIIHAPFWAWSSLEGIEENEDAYCRELLEEVI